MWSITRVIPGILIAVIWFSWSLQAAAIVGGLVVLGDWLYRRSDLGRRRTARKAGLPPESN
jgi:hypothetical protein